MFDGDASQRFCSAPGCPVLLAGGGRCPKHKAEQRKRTDDRRGNFRQRGYSPAWDRFREYCMSARLYPEFHGKCQLCGYVFKEGREVLWDHRTPLNKGGKLISVENTWPLCLRCNTKTGNA